MRISYKELSELVKTTNNNLKRFGCDNTYTLSKQLGYNLILSKHTVVCSGSNKECTQFLRGVNSVMNQNLYDILQNQKEQIEEPKFGPGDGVIYSIVHTDTINEIIYSDRHK